MAANSTAPSPCPVLPDLMLSQAPSVDADQAHSRAALTVMRPPPPVAGTVDAPSSETLHLEMVVGDVTVVVADEPQPATAAAHTRVARAAELKRNALRMGSATTPKSFERRHSQEPCHISTVNSPSATAEVGNPMLR